MTSQPDSTARYRDVLYEALAGGTAAVRDADPLSLLSRLTESAARVPDLPPAAVELIEGLDAASKADQLEAAIEAAAERFESPERFGEAIYFARNLGRDSASAIALAEARGYLEAATVPESLPELQTDRAAVLDAATFAALWHDAGRLDWMLHTTSLWRRDYAAVYSQRHATHAAALTSVAEAVEAAMPQAAALEKLNGLPRLGAPVGTEALTSFSVLDELSPCTLTPAEIAGSLEKAPACSGCGYRLGDEAPLAEARRVRGAIERGLATQQSRLAQRVVSRLLARPSPEDRLDRFVKVVQASDLAGLALVLDDALVDFLRDLLESDDVEPDLLQRFAAAYPEVTPANLDAAVAELRGLLEAEIERGGTARLAGEAP